MLKKPRTADERTTSPNKTPSLWNNNGRGLKSRRINQRKQLGVNENVNGELDASHCRTGQSVTSDSSAVDLEPTPPPKMKLSVDIPHGKICVCKS